MNNLEKIKELKLTEIREEGEPAMVRWTGIPDIVNTKSYLISRMEYGVDFSAYPEVFAPPVARVDWIFEQIALNANLKFEFPDKKRPFLKKLLIPCLTKNGITPFYSSETLKITFGLEMASNRNDIHMSFQSFNNYYYEIVNPTASQNSLKIKYDGTIEFDPIDLKSNIAIEIHIGNRSFALEYDYLQNNGTPYPCEYKPMIFNVKKGDRVYFAPILQEELEVNEGDHSIAMTFVPANEMVVGSTFPIITNLPDMKQTDFIISICAMTGMFPTVGGENTIRFITMDMLEENKSKALDWSNKLIAQKDIGHTPKDLSFSLKDFAKINYLRYKEGKEAITQDFTGILKANGSSIAATKDLITLAFVPSLTKVDCATIPFYKLDNEEVISNPDVGHRILVEDMGPRNLSLATFNGLSFNTLIRDHYKKFQEIILDPTTIKISLRLDEMDLKYLDYTIPVFLNQYGSYFAIIKIQVNGSGISDCELIKI